MVKARWATIESMSVAPLVCVLGPVRVGGSDPGGALARALVIALVLDEDGAPRTPDALTHDVWGESLPKHPRAALQSLVSRLRQVTGGIVSHGAGGYVLAAADARPGRAAGEAAPLSDLGLARRVAKALEASVGSGAGAGLAVGAGRAAGAGARALGDAAAHLALADEALALWHGEPGADAGDAPIASALAAEADALQHRLRVTRAKLLLQLGQPRDAAHELTALAAARPFDEPLHRDLMAALELAGDRSAAIEAFTAFRTRLRDETGTSPGPALLEAGAALLREQEDAHLAPVRLGVRSEPAALFGRAGDLDRLATLLRQRRLVTVLGPGGLGKTRIAHAVAAAASEPFVAVVSLASVRTDEDVAPAIAAALGVHEVSSGARLTDVRTRPELRSLVLAVLAERPALVVLDNCEQVIDGVAAWCADILGAAPRVRVLATSRTALGLPGEQPYPLGALEAVHPDDAAVQLFVERARAARSNAVLDLDTVARLCRHLDGLPLAIELAAARVRSMTPEQIEGRLRDRFTLLRNADRTAPERHRTLEAVIEWSWDLLDASAREALALLALLPDGFSADTAAGLLAARAEVAGEVADGTTPNAGTDADDLLDRLVAQSLLSVYDDRHAGALRFRMLETVREFGLSRLRASGTEDEAREVLVTWAVAYTRALGPRVYAVPGSLGPETFRRVRAEQENLLAALRVAIRLGRAAETVLILTALTQLWIVRGAFTEYTQAAEEVFGTVEHAARELRRGRFRAEIPVDAMALCLAACAVGMAQRHPQRALRCLAHLTKLRRSSPELSPMWVGVSRLFEAGLDGPAIATELRMLRQSADGDARLLGELFRGQIAENDGEPGIAREAAEHTWRLAEELGEHWIAAMSAHSLAELANQSANPKEAMRWFDVSRTGLAAFGLENDDDERNWLRGTILLALRRFDEAEPLFVALTQAPKQPLDGRELGTLGWFGLAEIARMRGDSDEALRYFERSFAALRERNQTASPWHLMFLGGYVAALSLDGLLPDDELAVRAARLRTRAIAVQRASQRRVDRPVLGAALAGWSAWAIGVPAERERGLELFALAEALGARQDIPSLVLATHRARAVTRCGESAVRAAEVRAAALPEDARVPRALELLGARAIG